MNRDLPVFPSALLLLLLVAMLVWYFYLVPNTLVKGPTSFSMDVEGQLWVKAHEDLVAVSPQGRVVNLPDHGIPSSAGEIIWIAPFTWLINKVSPQSSWQRMFAKPNHEWMLCQYRSKCDPWRQKNLSMTGPSHGLSLNKQVLISHSPGHSLALFSQAGVGLANLEKPLRFPNDLVEIESEIWLVDTNHKALEQIRVEGESLQAVQTIPIMEQLESFGGYQEQHSYPIKIAANGDTRWLLVGDGQLNNAGVYQFDAQWKAQDRLALEYQGEVLEPLDIMFWQQFLWMTDAKLKKLWRVDPATGQVQPMMFPQIESVLARQADDIAKAKLTLWLGLGVFSILALLCLIWALLLSKPASHAAFRRKTGKLDLTEKVAQRQAVSEPLAIPMNPWFDRLHLLQRWALTFVCLYVIGALGYFALKYPNEFKILEFKVILTFLILVAVMLAATVLAFRKPRWSIWVQAGGIQFKNQQGIEVTSDGTDIVFHQNALFCQGQEIPLQGRFVFFYHQDLFKKFALGILQRGQFLEPGKYFWAKVKHRHLPTLVQGIAAVIMITVLLISHYFFDQ